jgi:hypothetical protein
VACTTREPHVALLHCPPNATAGHDKVLADVQSPCTCCTLSALRTPTLFPPLFFCVLDSRLCALDVSIVHAATHRSATATESRHHEPHAAGKREAYAYYGDNVS